MEKKGLPRVARSYDPKTEIMSKYCKTKIVPATMTKVAINTLTTIRTKVAASVILLLIKFLKPFSPPYNLIHERLQFQIQTNPKICL